MTKYILIQIFSFVLVACNSTKIINAESSNSNKEVNKKVANGNSNILRHKLPVYVSVNSNFIADSIKATIKKQLRSYKYITIEKDDIEKYTRQQQLAAFDKVIALKNADEGRSVQDITKEVYFDKEPVIQFLMISCSVNKSQGIYKIDSLRYNINFYPPPSKRPVENILPDSFFKQRNIPETFMALIDSLSKK